MNDGLTEAMIDDALESLQKEQAENKRLRDALWQIGHEPCDAYQAEAIAQKALKPTEDVIK